MEIKNRLYKVNSKISGYRFFFTADNDNQAIEFIFNKFKNAGVPMVLNEICLDGRSKRVKLFTSSKWKELSKKNSI